MLQAPGLALNPGNYVSNLAIHDGPEYLYRGENPILTIRTDSREKWGVVSLEHEWIPIDSSARKIDECISSWQESAKKT